MTLRGYMKSEKKNQKSSHHLNFDDKVKEVKIKVKELPQMEIPTGKVYLNPEDLSSESWKKENFELFQVSEYDWKEQDNKIDKQMNLDYREEVQRELLDEIYNEAVNVRLDYEENPSEESESLIRIHQDSEFLKEE